MLQRQTQTAAFWRDQFEVTAEDLDFLFALLLDSQSPKLLSSLSEALIEEYVRKENAKIETELTKGDVYTPQGQFKKGQTLVFPALDFKVAKVTGVRKGHNPEHGEFDVMSVQFEKSKDETEFAFNLATPHVLNQTNGQSLLSNESLLSAEEIYELYQDEIEECMLAAFEDSDRSSEFVEVNNNWMLSDMLTEVNSGHLNITEAMIDMAAKPLESRELLAELDLDSNANEAMQVLSLNHALSKDERFDMVGSGEKSLWFLRRLEPSEALEIPLLLRPTQPTYNRGLLSVELLQLEWELDDEWGESSLSSELPSIVPSTNFTLVYPHRRSGTLPINGRTRSFFPIGERGRSIVDIIDGRWGTRMTGWVVHEGRYVTGLAKWMESHALPVGAQITLERTNNPNEVVIDYRTRRAKREWTRVATADLDKMKLTFESSKVQIACEYDENLIVSENESGPIGQLCVLLNQNRVELPQIVSDLMPELAKLNPNGTVHVKTVYSAANMLRRCPPGPVFFSLISNRKFVDVGGGFFALG